MVEIQVEIQVGVLKERELKSPQSIPGNGYEDKIAAWSRVLVKVLQDFEVRSIGSVGYLHTCLSSPISDRVGNQSLFRSCQRLGCLVTPTKTLPQPRRIDPLGFVHKE